MITGSVLVAVTAAVVVAAVGVAGGAAGLSCASATSASASALTVMITFFTRSPCGYLMRGARYNGASLGFDSLQLAKSGLDPKDTFTEPVHRSGVADADVVIRPERDAGHDRHPGFVEQVLRERIGIADLSLPVDRFHFREEVKRSVGIGAAQSVDCVDRRNEPRAPLRIRLMHFLDLGRVMAQRLQRRGLRDRARIG